MSGGEERAYPWLAERAETGADGESGSESGNGTRPGNAVEPAPTDGAGTSFVADSTPSMDDSGREPAVPFLQSLVDAMRKIAEQTRDDALATLRESVAERAAAIRAETEQRAAELREVADGDLAGVADWERAEIQRIRDEAGAKVSARNATLDAQLAANQAAGEGALTAVEARVDAFEAEMTSFFAQLNDIDDPASLGSALKRIPQPPSLAGAGSAPAGDTAPSPAPVVAAETPAAPVVTPAPEPAPEFASDVAVAAVPEMPAPAQPEAASVEEVPAEAAAAAAAAVAVATAPKASAESVPVEEAAAAALAQEEAEENGEEATTQVLVTGLTSFGAITSFKQSLEHVAGVHRVSLGLGTSGEFIFTAVHRAGFDLAAAIRTFEESAQFTASDGHLRVTVGLKA